MYYFAWVTGPDVPFDPDVHATRDDDGVGRLDEDIFAFVLDQLEGGAATLTLEIANPGVGLLAEGRLQWAYFAEDIGDAIVLRGLFKLDGIPDGLQHETLTIVLLAMPEDFEDQKVALAANLEVAPHFHRAWIDGASLDDPDTALIARTQSWHLDPVTHVLTVSDKIAGEDGLVVFTADEVFYDPVDLQRGEPPARRFELTAEAQWTQHADGSIDISPQLQAGFAAAGTGYPFVLSTYTAKGLVDDWPEPGRNIGLGWSVRDTNVTDASGVVPAQQGIDDRLTLWAKSDNAGITIQNTDDDLTSSVSISLAGSVGLVAQQFALKATLEVAYDVDRSYVERMKITLAADVQTVATDVGEAEVIRLALSADVGAPVGPDSTAGPYIPIGDMRRRSYFLTDDGKAAAQYFVARGRAALLDRARGVRIPFECDYDKGVLEVTTRKSATLSDPRLPGGTAQGKIVAWREAGNGDDGLFTFGVNIAPCIGNGNAVAAAAGTPVYAAAGVYFADGVYQARTGQTILVAGDVTLADYSTGAPNDDGVDLLSLGPANAVKSVIVTNGVTEQRDLLAGTTFHDLTQASEALQNAKTSVCVDLLPLTGGPFLTEFAPAASGPMVPKGIDLAGVST